MVGLYTLGNRLACPRSRQHAIMGMLCPARSLCKKVPAFACLLLRRSPPPPVTRRSVDSHAIRSLPAAVGLRHAEPSHT